MFTSDSVTISKGWWVSCSQQILVRTALSNGVFCTLAVKPLLECRMQADILGCEMLQIIASECKFFGFVSLFF